VNNAVNPETKKAALKLMEGGPSKINPPNSHPSNPVYKAATRAPVEPTAQEKKAPVAAQEKTPQHEINKTAFIIGFVGLSALLFMVWR